MKKEKLNIVYVPTSQLRLSDYNPRKWSNEAIKDLKASIKTYGFVDPLVVNSAPKRKGIVIGGHFRLTIAKELKVAEVPVAYINIPSIKKERELNLRLNKNTGEWDFDLLGAFDELLLADVGFSSEELDEVFANLLEVQDDEFDVEAELKRIKKPKAKLGDVYQLGSHRLVCGDALDLETVKRLVGKARIDMIYVDPMFNIGLDYDKGVGGKASYGGKTKDRKPNHEYRQFLKRSMENALAVAKPDCHVYYWNDQTHIGILQDLYRELGIDNRRVCLWIKGPANPVPSVAYNKAYEACVYGTRGKPYLSKAFRNFAEILNKEVGSGNQLLEDVMGIMDVWLTKRIAGMDYEHATQKPVTLHEKPLKRCTKPGDAILDTMGGSGSTLIAAEAMKRICYMIEIEPIFVDLIIRRYEKLTGVKAKKVS